MGFYGNITNVNKTQFTFDRTYPNRRTMEDRILNDSIYLGRYVLIEYGMAIDTTLDTYYKAYSKTGADGKEVFYDSPDLSQATQLRWTKNANRENPTRGENGKILTGQLIYVEKDITPEDNDKTTTYVFYQCTGSVKNNVGEDVEGAYATFTRVVNNTSTYTTNYNIDLARFDEGQGRGYDSTVWQKVYANGSEKYVMIAELNSVVPTFGLVEDAPTMSPLTPHFDADSTNVYYKLHWQPQWGLQIAAKEGSPSDSPTIWVKEEYDPVTDIKTKKYYSNSESKWKEYRNFSDVIKAGSDAYFPAAIYYNAAAFDPQIGADTIHKHAAEKDNTNYFTVLPTGKSGKLYNAHDGTGISRTAEDIQEMRINLPAIGNMMSDAWDIIHGPNRDDDMRQVDESGNVVESLQGRLDSIAAIHGNEIPVKRLSDGQLVGTRINGDNNRLASEIPEILREALSTSLTEDDAWIYTKINSNAITNEHNNGIAIHHTFHATQDSVSSVNKNNGSTTSSEYYKTSDLPTENLNANRDEIRLYTPYVDAAGHVVGKNIETVTLPYSYRTYTTTGLSAVDNADLYTVITSGTGGADSSAASCDSSNTIADQTQDTLEINPVNKWIQAEFEDDKLTLAHEIHAIPTTYNGTTNLNLESGAANEDNINIPDFEYDAAGHIIGKHDHKYTLPFGFKTITTNGRATEVSENATSTPVTSNVVADATQDSLAINSGNKWIRIDTDTANDTISIRHDVHETTFTSNTTDWTTTEANTIIPTVTYEFDEAGHYTKHHTENYKLPFGYGKIKGDSGTTEATATYDEITFTSDEWLTATVSKDTVTYSHDYPKKVDDSISTFNVNGNGDTIILETLARDDKGHVIKVNQNTVTLPYGYKTFNGDTGTTSADNTQDIMSVVGDSWISSVVENDKISLSHKTPVVGTISAKNNNEPKFGETFTIDDHFFDSNGHKFSSQSHTVKIPSLSLTAGTGNVVTGISLTPENGAFVETKANVGTLALTGYTKPTAISGNSLSANDSLNTNLGKLEYRLEAEVTRAEAAEAQVLVDAKAYTDATKKAILTGEAEESLKDTYDTLLEIQNWIEGDGVNATELAEAIAVEHNRAIKAEEDLGVEIVAEFERADGAEKLLDQKIEKEITDRKAITDALGTAATTNADAYATAAQGLLAASAIQASTTFSYGEEQKTIQELFNLVVSLQNEIATLRTDLAALQEKVNKEHPEPTPAPDEGGEDPTEPDPGAGDENLTE